jgi:putative glutamine amidotransferase
MVAVGQTYVHAIQRVGGTPVIIPPTMSEADWPQLVNRLDGLLLSGGEDITPTHYGEPAESWLGGVDVLRDTSELGLVRGWLHAGRPLLVICRGHQLLNIALGGTLYQDIATYFSNPLDHAYTPASPMENPVHSVTLTPDSRLARIFGDTTFEVNSAHHQAIKELGDGLSIVAHAPDGVIEAVEHQSHAFCIGVQWHPEAMVKLSDSMWPLFETFVKAAAG